jgi:hypothetical protein
MTRLITTIIFILIVSALTAQTKDKTLFVGNVLSDTATIQSHQYRTALKSIMKSKNKIEIRFITEPSFHPTNNITLTYNTNFTILTYDKEWSAKYYYCKDGTDTLLCKDITQKTNIDTIFSRLVLNNIFSLPSDDNLKTEKYEYNLETNEFIGSGMGIGDGICYCIEFKVGDRYRRYDFCNPNEYADFYPQVYELRNYANIVKIFKEWTKE